MGADSQCPREYQRKMKTTIQRAILSVNSSELLTSNFLRFLGIFIAGSFAVYLVFFCSPNKTNFTVQNRTYTHPQQYFLYPKQQKEQLINCRLETANALAGTSATMTASAFNQDASVIRKHRCIKLLFFYFFPLFCALIIELDSCVREGENG